MSTEKCHIWGKNQPETYRVRELKLPFSPIPMLAYILTLEIFKYIHVVNPDSSGTVCLVFDEKSKLSLRYCKTDFGLPIYGQLTPETGPHFYKGLFLLILGWTIASFSSIMRLSEAPPVKRESSGSSLERGLNHGLNTKLKLMFPIQPLHTPLYN